LDNAGQLITGFDPRSCGIWSGESGTGAVILLVLRVSLPIFIAPNVPRSGAGAIRPLLGSMPDTLGLTTRQGWRVGSKVAYPGHSHLLTVASRTYSESDDCNLGSARYTHARASLTRRENVARSLAFPQKLRGVSHARI
jgi:hypothetical protein